MINRVEHLLTKSELFGFVIERTAKKMKLAFGRLLAKNGFDITVDQWVILNLLKQEDGISQLELSEISAKDAPTITRILDILERKSLTDRLPDKSDRRKYSVHLTGTGLSKVQEILPLARAFREEAYSNLDIKHLDNLKNTLETIHNNLENY